MKMIAALLAASVLGAVVFHAPKAFALPASDERCVASQQIVPVFFKSVMQTNGRLGREPSKLSMTPNVGLSQGWVGRTPPLALALAWESSEGSMFQCLGMAESKDIAALLAPVSDAQWIAGAPSHDLLLAGLPVIDETGTKGMIAVELRKATWPGAFGMILYIEKRRGVWVEAGRRDVFNA
jgi:hypothetical protein